MMAHDDAAAELYRLAQAEAMMRMYREANGRNPSTMEELTQFMKGFEGKISPSYEDHEAVCASNPELVAVASSHTNN
jgi:hypothetical protein